MRADLEEPRARSRRLQVPPPTARGEGSRTCGSRSRIWGVLWSWGAGLRALGVLWSWGSHSSRGRCGQGTGVGAQRRLGVLEAAVLGALGSLQAGGWGGAGGLLLSPDWGAGLADLNPEHPWVPRTLTFLAFLPPAGAIFLVSQTAPNTVDG